MLRTHAPAKINLFLQVTGRQDDGYHLLDSLIVFSAFGDELAGEPASGITLSVDGPTATALDDEAPRDNLVLKAARQLAERAGISEPGARLALTKRIPVAAGLGGGSSDAAAALKLLSQLWQVSLPERELAALALGLGADIPVCLRGRATMARGIGEILDEAPRLPADLALVIAHTGKALPTPAVFRALAAEERSGAAPALPDRFVDAEAVCAFLRTTRNDLEAPAIRLEPMIGKLLDDMRATAGCLIARMSGSGAACFGLFASDGAASRAAEAVADAGWWAVATRLLA